MSFYEENKESLDIHKHPTFEPYYKGSFFSPREIYKAFNERIYKSITSLAMVTYAMKIKSQTVHTYTFFLFHARFTSPIMKEYNILGGVSDG